MKYLIMIDYGSEGWKVYGEYSDLKIAKGKLFEAICSSSVSDISKVKLVLNIEFGIEVKTCVRY